MSELSDEEKKATVELNNYIKIVLNLIEKQSKEIERLEARRYMYNAKTGEISQIPLNNNYISKDKIKEKIKKYDEWIKEGGDYVESLEAQRYALNELLEE